MDRLELTAAVALVLTLIGVGCSRASSASDPPPTSPSTTSSAVASTTTTVALRPTTRLDPCVLFTAADASRLAGTALTRAPSAGFGAGTCAYSGGKVLVGAELTVKVDAGPDVAHAEFRTWVEPVPNTAPGYTLTTVANLGDEAKVTHSTFTDGIYFRDGSVLVKIAVYPPVRDKALRTAATAARDRL